MLRAIGIYLSLLLTTCLVTTAFAESQTVGSETPAPDGPPDPVVWAAKAAQAEQELLKFRESPRYPNAALTTALRKAGKEISLLKGARLRAELQALQAKERSSAALTEEDAAALLHLPGSVAVNEADAETQDLFIPQELDMLVDMGERVNDPLTGYDLDIYQMNVDDWIRTMKENIEELQSLSASRQDLSGIGKILEPVPDILSALAALEDGAIDPETLPQTPKSRTLKDSVAELAQVIADLRTHTSRGPTMAPGVTCEPAAGIAQPNLAFDLPIRARFALLGENDPDARRAQCLAKAEEQARVDGRAFCRRFKGTLVEQGEGARLLNENLGYSLELKSDDSCEIHFVTQVECRF